MKHYLFTPIDSWFFRESRSMDGGGSSALNSVFPPPSQTLLGALRTQIGNRYFEKGGNWRDFSPTHDLVKYIGYGQDYGSLQAQGVWLYNKNSKEYYYPAPANLVQCGKNDDKQPTTYDFFALSEQPLQTDMGKLRLPELKKRGKNEQGIDIRDVALENQWISHSDYQRILNGEPPQQVQPLSELLTTDPRLGISRDNQIRRTEEGMLYQTNHIRLKDDRHNKDDWHVYLGLNINDDRYCPKDNTIIRLGGEARMALLQTPENAPEELQQTIAGTDFVLYLLTSLPDHRQNGQTPPLPNSSFTYNESKHCWTGSIANIKVDIISAVVGKVQRIGGWNIAKHESTPVQSYLPAGSCWYIHCQDLSQADKLIKSLHNQYLTTGNDRAKGYGQVVCGAFPHSSNP